MQRKVSKFGTEEVCDDKSEEIWKEDGDLNEGFSVANKVMENMTEAGIIGHAKVVRTGDGIKRATDVMLAGKVTMVAGYDEVC